MMIEAEDMGSYLAPPSEQGDKVSRHSRSSCKTSSEVGEAIRKVVIKKSYQKDLSQQLINLNQVSAMCPVLNLRKNEQHDIYLKANQISMKSLHNKDRIRRYLRETNLQLQTLYQLQTCFLKCDKSRTG
jgi:hypothetical protein